MPKRIYSSTLTMDSLPYHKLRYSPKLQAPASKCTLWEDSTDTNPLENGINPTHQQAIQEKSKKRCKKENPNERKMRNTRKENDDNANATTRFNHDSTIHRSPITLPAKIQNTTNSSPATPTAHYVPFVWPSSS
jgi:hypothetical protein